MGVLAIIKAHPKLLLAGLILLVAAAIVSTFASAKKTELNVEVRGGAWFTTDDGKTWFAADENKLPPFDHKGKQANRAYVYTCDGGKSKFVLFMARFTPEARRQLEEMRKSKMPSEFGVIDRLMTHGMEVKKPNDAVWVTASHPSAVAIRKPACPDGAAQTPQPVLP